MSDGNEMIRISAPAKVNLSLDILRRRTDGYHELRSVVMPVSLCDELTFEPADELHVSVTGTSPSAGQLKALSPGQNLIHRAAELIRNRCGCKAGALVTIEKRIPVGGGLAGGSTDAAATLRGLNALWKCELCDSELAELGAILGCDVPVMLCGRAAVMEGVGERVRELYIGDDLRGRGWWLVLMNPGFGVCTGDIYGRCKAGPLTMSDENYSSICSALAGGTPAQAAAALFNGLQEAALRKYPLLKIMTDLLVEEGALGALLSGSGASVFGLARSESDARAIEQRTRARLDFDVWSKVVRLLPDGVMAAHGPLEARV